MQPSLPPASTDDMESLSIQSMDWLFKKERIYLLAQFWQQRATLAEKEVNTLKEQLTATSKTQINTTLSNTASTTTITQNGTSPPSPSTTPLSLLSETNDNSSTTISRLLSNNSIKLDDENMDRKINDVNEMIEHNRVYEHMDEEDRKSNRSSPNLDTKKKSHNNSRENDNECNENENELETIDEMNHRCSSENLNNTNSRAMSEELSVKEKEISLLIEEIARLRTAIQALQESHNVQIRRLEQNLDEKRQHILRLEKKLSGSDFEDMKKENSNLRSVDLSTTTDSKQFQELLLEHSKSFAQGEKSSNDDDDDCLTQNQNHHHIQAPLQDVERNENSSTASTPILQENRGSEEHLSGRGGGHNSPSLPSLSKSPSEDNHPLLHNGGGVHGGPLSLGSLQFHPFGERGNNPHYKFADDLHLPLGSMVGRLGDSLIPKGDPMEARLQEMLRYNMDKYTNQNLDTLHISRRVRELLSVHNIGQRIFAKYVLGLSQGTVSELLSKPKPWDKLTEKGRDSYRKMHAWALDDQAILLLKSLIPKKESGMPPFGRSESNDVNDDRIQHILSEASNIIQKSSPEINHSQLQNSLSNMKILAEESHSIEDSKSPPPNCPSPFSKRCLKKYENDDISEEKLQKIYQEEFHKLMARGQRDAFPNAAGASIPPLADENVRLALEMYQREISKLQHQGGAGLPNFANSLTNLLALQHHQALANGSSIQDLSIPKEARTPTGKSNGMSLSESENDQKDYEESLRSAFSMVKPKPEPTSTPTTTASAPSPISNSILPPVTPTDEFSTAASPLQRMASITNSLITQPPVQSHVSSPQRPMKAVLPPITQQQFDMYNNLNTEDIVRRVKEALSQYSISQRLFGESVLGLSQGSVSDLLARPKPWHMLTQKGREPFIRMKMFLEDDNAVHKLVASQYKIAPDKLMRTGNYSSSPQIPAQLSKQMPPMPKLLSEQMAKLQDPALLHMQMSQMAHLAQQQHHQQQQQHRELQQREREREREQPMLLTPPGLPPQHAIQLPLKDQKSIEKKMIPIHSPQPENSQPQQNIMRSMNQHISPTVYEMAALTQDLDTQVITTKIKEALLANNIGQKIFGEAVLGLSQGSVSELLSKPKPWHMLSIKGREPFIRMQLWLNDANNVERLQLLKNERREAIKRRRSTGAGHDNSSDTSSNDTSEFYHSNSPGPASVTSQSAPPNKKQRVLFSEEQKEALRLAFALDPYPNVQTIEFLANELNLSTRTITNWFHNHRMRLKQQVPHGQPSEPIPSRENQTGAPFDPVKFRILLNQRLMEIQKERMGLGGMLPYPPYFAANPNLATLIGRGLLSGGDAEQLAALNNSLKEQLMGLDLSMTSLKRDDDDYDDMDQNSDNDDADDDNESINDSKHNNNNDQSKDMSPPPQTISRTSRRKPAAPQWLNPMITMTTGEWNDDKKCIPGDKEVIINGVCVMNQSSDFKATEEDEDESNVDNSNEESDIRLALAEGNEEDEIKKSFIKKPNSEKSIEKSDDVMVKKEVNEANSWEY